MFTISFLAFLFVYIISFGMYRGISSPRDIFIFYLKF